MGPCTPSRDHEACCMSNEALPKEVAAKVRVAVLGDFQPKHVNSFPMKPDEGYFDLVSPSSYRHSILLFAFIISRLVFLKFGSCFARGQSKLGPQSLR